MDKNKVALTLSPEQLDAFTGALSFYEQLCRGDLGELLSLMQKKVVVNYTASNEPICPVLSEQQDLLVKPVLDLASGILGYAPGERLALNQLKPGSNVHLLLEVLAPNRLETTAPGPAPSGPLSSSGTLQVGLTHAYAIKNALDVYTRVCIGQFTIVTECVLAQDILCFAPYGQTPKPLSSSSAWGPFQTEMINLKRALGFSANGSYGIGHPHVHISALRAWEILKVLSKALAEHRTPSPKAVFRGVDYDGLIVRYTDDTPPAVTIL